MQSKPNDRAAQRLAWAREVLNQPDLTLQSASSDASFRSYWRTTGTTPSRLVMDAPPPNEDLRPWLDIRQRLTDAGVHVPSVWASDATRGFAMIEDFGTRSYLDALADDTVDILYGQAMVAMLRMQLHASVTALPEYDATRLREEMDLLRPWFLERHLGVTLSATHLQTLHECFDILITSALEQPLCFVHRDYHSRNLMCVSGDGPGIIDFQDAVRGPVTYDLVSLLRDCYVDWSEAQVTGWCTDYHQRLIDAGILHPDVDVARFQRWFDLMGVQRHLKVLGIFCRLCIRDGKPGYLADLPRVLGYVLRVAARHAELASLAKLLDDATRGRDIRAPASTRGGQTACTP